MQKKVVVTDRTIWGWDDGYVFSGNKNRGIDIISPLQRTTIFTLRSPYLLAVQCQLAAHPFNIGMLAAARTQSQG